MSRTMGTFFGAMQTLSLHAWYRSVPSSFSGPVLASALTCPSAKMIVRPVYSATGPSDHATLVVAPLGYAIRSMTMDAGGWSVSVVGIRPSTLTGLALMCQCAPTSMTTASRKCAFGVSLSTDRRVSTLNSACCASHARGTNQTASATSARMDSRSRFIASKWLLYRHRGHSSR